MRFHIYVLIRAFGNENTILDVEALVISDYGISSILSNNFQTTRRRSLKIMDQSGTIIANVWNDKVYSITNTTIDKILL